MAVVGALTVACLGGMPGSAGAAVPHTVEPGETLWSIAAASNFTTRALAAFNGLSETSQVVVGSTIQIPSESEAAAALGGVGQPVATPSQPAPAPTSGGPTATAERSSPQQVGEVAAAHGTPPAVAKGIAYQESGFNNAAVSSAGAKGVMQIMPGTWDFIQKNLAGYDMSETSAYENVHGGVMYLNYLQRTMGDLTTAIGAYYQGPNSVKQNGFLPETQRYVDNVMSHSRRFGGG